MSKSTNPGPAGSAFQRCVKAVTKGGSAYDPRAVCVAAGRQKYGKKRFQEMAAAGKRRAARGNPPVSAVRGRGWIQEWYETGSSELKQRSRELRQLGYRISVSGMGNQVTQWGKLKMSLLDIRPGGSGDSSLESVPNPANLSDRALRYRANAEPPAGPKQCGFCGSKKNIEVGHINGREEDGKPENLIWTCRSCNVLAGNTLRKAGIGRLTVQYNPADGAKSVGQWLNAVGAIIPHEYPDRNIGLRAASTMSVRDAVAMIRATSQSKRREFAAKLRRRNPADIWALERKRAGIWEQRVVGADEASMKGTLKWYQQNYPGEKWRIVKIKRNPAAAATEAFEEFHGHRPDETVEVRKQVHFHGHLAGAGQLRRLVVKGVDHRVHSISGFKGALLAFNEEKTQLFIEGGDQALNLADFGITEPHEIETLGKVVDIDYATDKHHLGEEGGKAVYAHRFRTTNQNGQHVTVTIARYPDLIYRVRDEQLEFSGGSYQIKAEGIDR